jgi:hypothetical protein
MLFLFREGVAGSPCGSLYVCIVYQAPILLTVDTVCGIEYNGSLKVHFSRERSILPTEYLAWRGLNKEITSTGHEIHFVTLFTSGIFIQSYI